jgi:catechol 2,3-dioxygenase-like lactoylglutathione lyase family enzyme
VVSDHEFDEIFGRLEGEGVRYGSQPTAPTNGEINTRRGGRGLYFADPDGHLMEIMTVPE